jgi:carboxyl-terminal processing protease
MHPSVIQRILFVGILAAAALGLAYVSFTTGFDVGQETPRTIYVRELVDVATPESAKVDFGTFWQAWDLISEEHLKGDEISAQEKVYGAIRGLVFSLKDPNSEFFSPKDGEKFQEDIRGNFGGIGAEIGKRDEQIIIIAPLKDTPAEQAGLKAGDRVLQIDETDTQGLSVQEAVQLIRGPRGTQVTLTVFRDGWERPEEFTITRDTIVAPTLEAEKREEITHLKLYSFNDNTNRLLYEEMVKQLTAGTRGIVLDLRNNPGGYLEVAVDVAGWFLKRGTLVVSEVGIDETKREFRARGNEALVDFPVVVLINQGSASASEILAGALRAHRGTPLVGEKSFGKGTVQELRPLKDGSSLKLTTAHWLLPNGEVIEEKGITPDIAVEISEEDAHAKRDSQLEEAIRVLRQEIAKVKQPFFFVIQ